MLLYLQILYNTTRTIPRGAKDYEYPMAFKRKVKNYIQYYKFTTTLSAKNFGAKYFGGKIFGGKNFGGILTISVINFGGIRKNFGGSRKFRCCQLKQKNLTIWLILTETEQNLYRM